MHRKQDILSFKLSCSFDISKMHSGRSTGIFVKKNWCFFGLSLSSYGRQISQCCCVASFNFDYYPLKKSNYQEIKDGRHTQDTYHFCPELTIYGTGKSKKNHSRFDDTGWCWKQKKQKLKSLMCLKRSESTEWRDLWPKCLLQDKNHSRSDLRRISGFASHHSGNSPKRFQLAQEILRPELNCLVSTKCLESDFWANLSFSLPSILFEASRCSPPSLCVSSGVDFTVILVANRFNGC